MQTPYYAQTLINQVSTENLHLPKSALRATPTHLIFTAQDTFGNMTSEEFDATDINALQRLANQVSIMINNKSALSLTIEVA